MVQFNGFPKEITEFLFSLQFKNNTEFLSENKILYKKLITEPLTSFYYAIHEDALSVSDTLITRPSRCISSMYNDMRFSRNTPLKEYMYIRFVESSYKNNILGLYFDMGRENYSYGLRVYKQTSSGMDKIRTGIIENRKCFSQELNRLDSLNLKIKSNQFAKDHYPSEKSGEMKTLLNSKNFYISCECPINETVFKGNLINEVSQAYHEMAKIYSLLKTSLYS